MPVSYEKPDQALISEFFAGRGSGFRHPIGKENEPVSRGKLDLVLLVIPTREHAEHGAPFPQAGVRAVSSQENGGIMSGTGVQQLPFAGIVETIEKGDEPVRRDVAAYHAIYFYGDVPGLHPLGSKSLDGSLQVGHQEGGGHSLPRHIGDAQGNAAVAKPHDVEVISSDGAGRLP